MTVKRVFAIFAIIVIVGAGLLLVIQNKRPTPAELLKAEQEVYAVLLADQKNAYNSDMGTFQIVEFTNAGELMESIPEDSAGYTADLNIDELSKLERETLIDFQEKNKVAVPIKDYLSPKADVIFVNPSNSEQLYWWVSFSRIGFNPSLTQALVLVGDCRGESCYDSMVNSIYSQGFYALLEKKDGKWLIQDYQRDWLMEAPAP